MNSAIIKGVQRRAFRRWLRWQSGRLNSSLNMRQGESRLWGYGMRMAYPDYQVWLWQMMELFVDDCYGIRRLGASARVVDAGANIGTCALQVLWRCPNAHVITVEPDPYNLTYLRKNLSPWLNNQVEVVPAALGSEKGVARFGGLRSDSLRLTESGEIEVEVCPLNMFLERPVDLLKMDIEGGEGSVLQAAGSALRTVKRVALEYHQFSGKQNTLPDCMSILRAAGFDRFSIHHLREFLVYGNDQLEHCCIIDGWRSHECH